MRVKQLIRSLSILGLVLSLTGCVNFYSNFYKQANGVNDAELAANRVAPPPETPVMERVDAPTTPEEGTALISSYFKRGYTYLGTSSFNTTISNVSDNQAIEQGKKLKADLVAIFNRLYTGSTTQTVAREVPVSSTTTETVNDAKIKGSRGTVKATDKTRTTTTVTATEMVNVSYDHYAYGADYFVKQKPGLGVGVRDLDDSERKKFQTNKGVHIVVVANDSPAFNADILPDDVILTLNGQPTTPTQLMDSLKTAAGQKVQLLIVRDGKKLTKTLQFPEAT